MYLLIPSRSQNSESRGHEAGRLTEQGHVIAKVSVSLCCENQRQEADLT